LKPVVRLFRRHNRRIFAVKLVTSGGRSEVIGASAGHPFHVRKLGWVVASKLVPGQIVDQLEGDGARVVSVKRQKRLQDTYNFEVAEAHTYFAGQSHAWVHNQSFCSWETYFNSTYGPGNVVKGGGSSLADAEVAAAANQAIPGLVYRSDLATHLVDEGANAFSSSKGLFGTHNMQAAETAITNAGGDLQLLPTGTPGIYEMDYVWQKASGALKRRHKDCI